MSTLKCPTCSSKKFYVTAHVSETWQVNEHGDFEDTIKDNDQQVLHEPSVGSDSFTCAKCGSHAVVCPE